MSKHNEIKLKHILAAGLAGLLVLGLFLGIGFLSFTEMLSLYELLSCAIAAFLLAGLVEGTVYYQNIYQVLFKDNLETDIYQKHFKALRKLHSEDPFIKEYNAIAAEIKTLGKEIKQLKWRKFNDHFDSEDAKTLEQYQILKLQKKKALRWLEQYFADVASGKIDDVTLDFLDDKKRKKIQKEIKLKSVLSGFSWVASIISGIGYGLVFLHVAPESIVALSDHFHLGLSLTALPLPLTIGIYVFAVIAAVGFKMLIRNTLNQMIKKDVFTKDFKKIAHFFSRQTKDGKQETTSECVLRISFWILLSLIIVGLCVFAAVTTAGTWWNEAQAALEFLIPYVGTATVWIGGSIIAVMGLTTLIYMVFNSLRALESLSKASWTIVKAKAQESVDLVYECYENETGLQFFNPFRALMLLISLPFKVLVFLGHVIATGLVGEGSNMLPENLSGMTAGFNAVQDAVVDGFFFFEDEDGHDHSHSGIPEFFLNVVFLLSTIMVWRVLWDWCSSDTLTFSQACHRGWHGTELSPKKDAVAADQDDVKSGLKRVEGNDTTSQILLKVVTHKVGSKVKELGPTEITEKANYYAAKIFNQTDNPEAFRTVALQVIMGVVPHAS